MFAFSYHAFSNAIEAYQHERYYSAAWEASWGLFALVGAVQSARGNLRTLNRWGNELVNPVENPYQSPFRSGDGGNCFVAGTLVMMGGDPNQIATTPATATGQPEAGGWNWTTLLLAAATVPIALAGYQFGRRKSYAEQQPSAAVDSVFESHDLDDLWSQIPNALTQPDVPRMLSDVDLDELCNTLFHCETLEVLCQHD